MQVPKSHPGVPNPLAAGAATRMKSAQSDRDARQIADVYLPRIAEMASADEKRILEVVKKAEQAALNQPGLDSVHAAYTLTTTRRFLQNAMETLAQGVTGTVGTVLAGLACGTRDSLTGFPIYKACLDGVREHGGEDQVFVATTVAKAVSGMRDLNASSVMQSEFPLLASSAPPPRDLWIKEAALVAAANIQHSYDGQITGGPQMGSEFLAAIASTGSPAQKIFAEAARDASGQDSGAVATQRWALRALNTGIAEPVVPELLKLVEHAPDFPAQLKVLEHVAAVTDATSALVARTAVEAAAAIGSTVGSAVVRVAVDHLSPKSAVPSPDALLSHFGLAALDAVDDRSGVSIPDSDARSARMRIMGTAVLKTLAQKAELPSNRELAQKTLNQSTPQTWWQRLTAHSHDTEVVQLQKTALDQIEMTARAHALPPRP